MRLLATVLLVLTLAPADLAAQAIRRLEGFNAKSIPANDDGSSSLVQLPFTINFFGRIRSSGYVNNNGNITLDSPLATFTPFGLENTRREIIAAFFGDVDTRGAGSRLVTYGEDRIDNRLAFGVNYINVGYFASHTDKLNSFQIVLIDRSDTGSGNFDVEFNYEKIQWETGDASGGAGGLGGTPAVVGWSNGSGLPGTSFELDGSLVNGAFLDNGPRALARRRLNNPVFGRYLFRARGGQLSPGLAITTSSILPPASLGIPYTANFTAEGGTNPYRWALIPDGAPLPGLSMNAQGVLSGTPTAKGSFPFTVTVTSRVDNADETVALRPVLEITSPALTIESRACPLADAMLGSAYSRTLRATGGPGPYVWTWGQDGSSPVPGLSLSESGAISGTPTQAGSFSFQLRVAGAAGSDTLPAARTCTLNVRQTPVEPSASGCPSSQATVGVPFSTQLRAAGGTDPWIWEIIGRLPAGMSWDSQGRLGGTATAAGEYTFDAAATDRALRTVRTSCTLTVVPQVISMNSSCPLPDMLTGETVNTKLMASGGQAPYLWSLSGSLPPGLSLLPDGTISGVANASGSWRFLVIAEDAKGTIASQPCSLSVGRATLSITGCPLPDGKLGDTYFRELSAVGGVAPYRWSSIGKLPAGLALQSSGAIAGQSGEPGANSFQVKVTDFDGKQASVNCSIYVQPLPLRIQRPCPLPDATVGSFYREYGLVAGGFAPYRWRMEGNSIPGIRLGSDGVISGTPTASGKRSFTLIAEDARGVQMRQGCTLDTSLPALPELTIRAASNVTSNISVDIELARAYSLPIRGEITVSSKAMTGSPDPEVNIPDPAVQFLPAGNRVAFTLPAGTRSTRLRLASTGTVAAEHLIRIDRLVAGGEEIASLPAAARLETRRTVPTLSDACYLLSTVNNQSALTLQLSGLTSTRELTALGIELNGRKVNTAPISAVSYDYFSNPLNVRGGGSFRMDVPVLLNNNEVIPRVEALTVRVANREGESAARTVRSCN